MAANCSRTSRSHQHRREAKKSWSKSHRTDLFATSTNPPSPKAPQSPVAPRTGQVASQGHDRGLKLDAAAIAGRRWYPVEALPSARRTSVQASRSAKARGLRYDLAATVPISALAPSMHRLTAPRGGCAGQIALMPLNFRDRREELGGRPTIGPPRTRASVAVAERRQAQRPGQHQPNSCGYGQAKRLARLPFAARDRHR